MKEPRPKSLCRQTRSRDLEGWVYSEASEGLMVLSLRGTHSQGLGNAVSALESQGLLPFGDSLAPP